MAAPWEKYAAKSPQAGPWAKYSAATSIESATAPKAETDADINARVQAKYGNMSFLDKVKGDLGSMVSGTTPIVRGAWDAISALPGLAADAGVGLRNVLTGSNYDLPSKESEKSLDTVLPMPTTPGARELRFGTSLLAGAKLPVPQAAQQAPEGFVKPSYDAIRQATLQNSQKAGYVVPPSTTNPSLGNKVLESLGGKVATAQDAATKNQDVTNTLAKRAIGLSEDAPMTLESLKAVRGEAGKAYDVLRSVNSVPLDAASTKALDEVAAKFTGSKLKDALGGGNDLPKIVQALKDEPLNGDSAVDAMALLRDKADVAYRAGDSQLGKAYKTVSKTIENRMENELSGDALNNFREARQLIAKTHSVEGAFNPSTGNVVATKLASQLSKNKPLSGDLKLAAQFGQAFPKAAQGVTDSGSVRNTDVMMSAGTAALSKEKAWLMYPFARQAARAFLLSKPGQKLAQQSAAKGVPPEVLLSALIAEEQSRKSVGKK